MRIARKPTLFASVLFFAAALLPLRPHAEDTDLFVGKSGGLEAAPKIMILLDNMNNWVNDSPNGKSKINALKNVISTINTPLHVGLAMYKKESPPGAYIRFGPRDMNDPLNKAAFLNLLTVIATDANAAKETGAQKAESEALFEIWRYFNALAPLYGGKKLSGAGFEQGVEYRDFPANTPSPAYPGSTAFLQGLTTGHALNAASNQYNSVDTECSRNYIIYIVANNGTSKSDRDAATYGLNTGPLDPKKTVTVITPSPGAPATFADEWARFLYRDPRQTVTYVLDAFFPVDNQDIPYSNQLKGIAKQGGGTYKAVMTQADIEAELKRILDEVKSVNSTYSSASLPVSATNRAQEQNQVFIGMFRPDPDAKPRWFGNLKRYQLIVAGGRIVLGDAAGQPAVSNLTGFLQDCAQSFWSTPSLNAPGPATQPAYWTNVSLSPPPLGKCPGFDPYSDFPDGPQVEKGGAAEAVRKGNSPPGTDTAPDWVVRRTIYTNTLAGGPLVPFTAATSGLPVATAAATVKFISGQDTEREMPSGLATGTRPSIHGDVLHSRPLPITYSATESIVYYGSNDGLFRAVNSVTGNEVWSFVAPEHMSKLDRLRSNTPLVVYNTPLVSTAPKGFFFDGPIGVYQKADNSKITIFPAMRRGGRMIYAFDVSNKTTPVFKWKAGCPNMADDVGCGVFPSGTATGIAQMGQTWSIPQVGFIKGYSTTKPVVVVGGGYNAACEDANIKEPACASNKGNKVFVLDADTGSVIRDFDTVRSVAADPALIDTDFDNFADFAYIADSGGNLYRIDFGNGANNPPTPLAPASWVITKVASTATASGRKFLFAPALFGSGQSVYVGLGSGDREHPLRTHYAYDTVVNRFYVYIDDLKVRPGTAHNLDDAVAFADFTATPTCTGTAIVPGAAKKGWFRTLNAFGQGEQTVTSAVIVGGLITFSTNRPVPTAVGTCQTLLGEARGYFLNLATGSGAIGVSGACDGDPSDTFVGGGMPPSPVLGTVPIGGVPKTVLIGAIQKDDQGPSSPISPQEVIPPITPVRTKVYWYPSGTD